MQSLHTNKISQFEISLNGLRSLHDTIFATCFRGTLTWGSRSSLATTNAWGNASISSPNTDGSAGSPSHRPSSGGSGTRPSTAGSDRSHEPVSSAWGPNSRPSSASGILASSQISVAATRPRSAETRPGSSQLSRFADNSVDNTVAWGAAGTAERLVFFTLLFLFNF